MNGKKASVALAALSLLVFMCIGYDGAPASAAWRLSSVGSGTGATGPGAIPPDCSTLDVMALTPNVSSSRSKVAFQVSAGLWCNWTASSELIQNITPSQGASAQFITAIVPQNPNHEARAAVLSVTSLDGAVVRTATMTQAAAAYTCADFHAEPTSIYPPGAFITVKVPPGWTWSWHPITALMEYHCAPSYPDGVDCRWQCTNIEPRSGDAKIRASGDGLDCGIPIWGEQPMCPPPTPTARLPR